jgi:hypothetical protein
LIRISSLRFVLQAVRCAAIHSACGPLLISSNEQTTTARTRCRYLPQRRSGNSFREPFDAFLGCATLVVPVAGHRSSLEHLLAHAVATDLSPINRVSVDSGHSAPSPTLESAKIRRIVSRQRDLEYYLAILERTSPTNNAPFHEERIPLMFVPPKFHHLLASMLASDLVIDAFGFSA